MKNQITPPEPRPIPGHEPDRKPVEPPQPRPLDGQESELPAPPPSLLGAASMLLLVFLLFSLSAFSASLMITNDESAPLTWAWCSNNIGGTYYLAGTATVAPAGTNAIVASGNWPGLLAINTNLNVGVLITTNNYTFGTNGYASCILSNGTAVYVAQWLGVPPPESRTLNFTNWLFNLNLPLPGYTQTLQSTNGGAFFLNDTNVYTGWFTNAPSGMTRNSCAVSYTNYADGNVFTNGIISTNLATAPLLQITNFWQPAPASNAPASVSPWATYLINRY